MKVLIFEDEAPAARKIIKLLNEYDPDIVVLDVIESVGDGIEWFDNNQTPDLIISDIQLSDTLSFELFSQLEIKTPVIFTTAYNEFAIEAFRHYSIDYLLKPIKFEMLSKSIDKFKNFGLRKDPVADFDAIINKLKGQNYRNRFLVNYRTGLIPVDSSDVAYFYSEDGVTFIMRKDKKQFIIGESLDNLEGQLNPDYFFRANRKFILSVESVEKVEPYFNQKLIVKVVPESKSEIVISKIKATNFKGWLDS
jgi:two-component system, LytTR family, response regulator